MTVNEFVQELQKRQEKYGDAEIEFYSWEWSDDLEDEKYKEKHFRKMFVRNNALRIYID